jgi:hypothetical protein
MKITKTLTWTDLIVRIVLIVVLIAAGPLAFIWSVNAFGQYLWPERIVPYTIETWVAALLLGSALGPKIQNKG